MKYFRNACSTLSTRSAWPWRDGVHIIYVTAHFTHTNATQPLLMLWQFAPLQHSHKGLRIHCGCWSRKKKKKSSSNADLYRSLYFLFLAGIQTQFFTLFASSFWPYKHVSAIIQGSLPSPVGLFQSMTRDPEPPSWAGSSPQEVKEKNPSKRRRKNIHKRTSQDWYSVLLSFKSILVYNSLLHSQLDFKEKKNKFSINN